MDVTAEQPNLILGKAFVFLLRFVALVLIGLSLSYWLRAIGYFDGPDFRFDTMPTYWKVVSSLLCVLLPVAALGLWGPSSWGVVLWIITVAIELVMYGVYPELFGQKDILLWFHISSVTAFFVLKLLQWFDRRRNAEA